MEFLRELSLSSGEQKSLAATRIQTTVRAWLARKVYLDLLYKSYEAKMNQMEEFTRLQTEENLIQAEKKKFIEEEEDQLFFMKQKALKRNYAASRLQRAWRKFRARHPQTQLKKASQILRPQTAVDRLKKYRQSILLGKRKIFDDDENEQEEHKLSNSSIDVDSLSSDDDESIEDQEQKKIYQSLIAKRQQLLEEREEQIRRAERTRANTFYSRSTLLFDSASTRQSNLDEIQIQLASGGNSPEFRRTMSAFPGRRSTKRKKGRTASITSNNFFTERLATGRYTKYELGKKSIFELQAIRSKLETEVEMASTMLKEELEEREDLNSQNRQLFGNIQVLVKKLRVGN